MDVGVRPSKGLFDEVRNDDNTAFIPHSIFEVANLISTIESITILSS